MLKTLQARLQQYVNQELPDVQARFRKGRGTRDQIANIYWITEKAREFQKKNSNQWVWELPSVCFLLFGIPAELFQILKDDAVKVLHSICEQIWKTQQWPQDWK